jgi:zinc transporter
MTEEEKGALGAYLLDGKGGARQLDKDEIALWKPEQGVLWMHINYMDDDERVWLRESSGLESFVVDAMVAEESRPRTTAVGDALLMALRGVNLKPGAEPDDMISIRLWVEPSRIITARRYKLLSVQDILEQLKSNRGPKDSADFIVNLADRLVMRMSDTVDNFEDRAAELEEAVLTGEDRSLKYELAGLRRQTISVRRYLAPQREALARLSAEKVNWMGKEHELRLREVSDRLIRHIEDLDAVRERATVIQDELLSRLSEQMNAKMYVLSVVAAVFLPLGFLTGLLGINIGGIPGAENPTAFLEFIAILLVVVVLQVLLFRWKRWF